MKPRLKICITFLLLYMPLSSGAQTIVTSFESPGSEPRGLAWDGEYLWCADADKDSIFKIDPATGQVIHSIYFDMHHTYGSGIVWSGDVDIPAIWITRWQYFYKLDAQTSKEIANFHCPAG